MKRALSSAFYWVQALILIVAGCVTLWWSEDLMLWLIHLVGEERALGAGNVIRDEGGKLLTNPVAMIQWTLPFWILGFVQLCGGLTLIYDWYRRVAGKPVERRPGDLWGRG